MADSLRTDQSTTETQTCPECGYENDPTAMACTRCMAALPSALAELSLAFTSMLKQLAKPCPVCAHTNRIGELVCENCGAMLVSAAEAAAANTTNPLEKDESAPDPTLTSTVPRIELPGKGTAPLKVPGSDGPSMPDQTYFDDDMLLRLEVTGWPTPIMLYPSLETVIGRRDPVSGQAPDVDLGVFAGYRLGISRRHAVLSLHDHAVEIIDQGSSNGTQLNGRPLTPSEPELLRNGDVLIFGKMVVKVAFVKRS